MSALKATPQFPRRLPVVQGEGQGLPLSRALAEAGGREVEAVGAACAPSELTIWQGRRTASDLKTTQSRGLQTTSGLRVTASFWVVYDLRIVFQCLEKRIPKERYSMTRGNYIKVRFQCS